MKAEVKIIKVICSGCGLPWWAPEKEDDQEKGDTYCIACAIEKETEIISPKQ